MNKLILSLHQRIINLLFGIFLLIALPSFANDIPKVKFGNGAVSILQSNDYLRTAPAPDYWLLSAFYIPQATSSDCSAASVTMAINAIRGLPKNANQLIFSEKLLLNKINNAKWSSAVADNGSGVNFKDLQDYLRQSLDKTGFIRAMLSAVHITYDDPVSLKAFRKALIKNEASAANIMLIYFNQGVVTGDWDGPHVSLVGAFDAARDRVLIMDVDRNSYVPYWTSSATLFKAFVKPAPADQGILAGETGGYITVTKP